MERRRPEPKQPPEAPKKPATRSPTGLFRVGGTFLRYGASFLLLDHLRSPRSALGFSIGTAIFEVVSNANTCSLSPPRTGLLLLGNLQLALSGLGGLVCG